MHYPAEAAKQFKPSNRVIDIREFGSGNINKTFLVTLDAERKKHFILQRINTRVFHQPELVVRNMCIVTEHVRQRLENAPPGAGRWEVPHVLTAQDGKDYWMDREGSFWRAISFIEDAQSFNTVRNIEHARQAGHALGMFHNLLSDLPCEKLSDTLKGFHITPLYLRHYDEVIAEYKGNRSSEVKRCLQFVEGRSNWAHVLEDAKKQGRLRLRTIHGDPKINNIMIDTSTGQAVGIVDLDTVKPGLVHYDIGDCLRSGCNPSGEETENWETVFFDSGVCSSMLHGYLSVAGEFLTEYDFDYMFDSIRLLAFELGLRFFTDYMEGDVYFKVNRPEHNLMRALVQFRLAESIELQEKEIRDIIAGV